MVVPLEPVGTRLGKWGGLDTLDREPQAFGRRYINESELVEDSAGDLVVWVSFGGAGWLPVWSVADDPELPDLHTLERVPEWSGTEPYDVADAHAEVLRILADLGR